MTSRDIYLARGERSRRDWKEKEQGVDTQGEGEMREQETSQPPAPEKHEEGTTMKGMG